MKLTVTEILKRLGYTSEWLDLGIVTKAGLRAQYAEFSRGLDTNAEHYRHGAFCSYLKRVAALSDVQVRAILALRDAGVDGRDLSQNRTIDLLVSGILTKGQFEGLADHPAVARPTVARRYRRESLLRRLRRDGLTGDLFAAISATTDARLHEAVLPLATARQLEWLRDKGANKSIRNQAGQRLGRRKTTRPVRSRLPSG